MNTHSKRDKAPPKGWRVSEIAESLHIPRSTIYLLIKTGELPAVRFSETGLLVLEEDLIQFFHRRRRTLYPAPHGFWRWPTSKRKWSGVVRSGTTLRLRGGWG